MPPAATRAPSLGEPSAHDVDEAVVALQPAPDGEDALERMRITPVGRNAGERPHEHVTLRVAAPQPVQPSRKPVEIGARRATLSEIEDGGAEVNGDAVHYLGLITLAVLRV